MTRLLLMALALGAASCPGPVTDGGMSVKGEVSGVELGPTDTCTLALLTANDGITRATRRIGTMFAESFTMPPRKGDYRFRVECGEGGRLHFQSGKLRVEPGKVVDLGRIVVSPGPEPPLEKR